MRTDGHSSGHHPYGKFTSRPRATRDCKPGADAGRLCAAVVLATYNIKGGVGKTSAAVNLAYLAARAGATTLLWDLDPQGEARTSCGSSPR